MNKIILTNDNPKPVFTWFVAKYTRMLERQLISEKQYMDYINEAWEGKKDHINF